MYGRATQQHNSKVSRPLVPFIRSVPRQLRDVRPGIRIALALALAGVSISLLTAVAPRCSASSGPSPVTLAFAGDSTTAKPLSWLHQLNTSVIDPVGGFAHSGWTSGQVLAKLSRVKADVLVVMLGINDLHYSATDHIGDVIANVNRIVARVSAQKVILSAVAPSNVTHWWRDGSDSRAAQAALNVALRADAIDHGWDYTDPWARLRAKDGSYLPGYSLDNIHPTPAGSALVARSLTESILAIATPARCRRV